MSKGKIVFYLFHISYTPVPLLLCAALAATLGLRSAHAAEVSIAETLQQRATATDQPTFPLEQINQYTSIGKTPDRVTSVSQLSDVQPTDWAFIALESLIQRGCITGYRDRTFRGNQALTRYEFAASLNTCLSKVNELIAAGTTDAIDKEDLSTLQRLQEEFAAELATSRGRVDNLEAQITKLELQQFSTTAELEGEVIFAINAAGGTDKADGSGDGVDKNPTLSNRVRLNIEASFTGEDRLQARLQARNTRTFTDATGTDMARLGFEGNNNNEVDLSQVEYRFPLGQQVRVYLEALGGGLNDFTYDLNPLGDITDSGTGSISRFGQGNPIYRQGGSTGAGIIYRFAKGASLSVGYVADDTNAPEDGIGGGSYGALAQLTFRPSKGVGIGLTYVFSYNSLETGTGSERSNDPFDGETEKVTANSYGVELSSRISPAVILAGWIGFTQAGAEDLPNKPEASIVNYAVTLAFPDLGKEGNVGGIVIGQPPKVTNNDYKVRGEKYQDEDTSLHLEAFYVFQATENIAITPGMLVIINPEHNDNNDTVYVGTIRTTFSF